MRISPTAYILKRADGGEGPLGTRGDRAVSLGPERDGVSVGMPLRERCKACDGRREMDDVGDATWISVGA